METLQALTDFYNEYDEDGRLTSKNGMVEYLTTMRYVDKYLKPGMRILEIGAATGRYSHALARKGFCVDAVELVQHNIDIFKANTHPGERVSIRQGNAKDLSFIPNNTYDITLLLGPMYHLFSVEDQLQALTEAIRVTKLGGVIFAAYCGNDATMIQYCFGRGMLKEKKYQDLVKEQRAILKQSAKYVKRGGVLLYSTCTVLKAENESTIRDFLVKNSDFEIMPFDGAESGEITLYPNDNYDGFYVAKLRKK